LVGPHAGRRESKQNVHCRARRKTIGLCSEKKRVTGEHGGREKKRVFTAQHGRQTEPGKSGPNRKKSTTPQGAAENAREQKKKREAPRLETRQKCGR